MDNPPKPWRRRVFQWRYHGLCPWGSIVALTPVEVLGCFLRGLIALLIALISGVAALMATIIGTKRGTGMGTKERVRYDKNSIWWVLSTLILVIPVVAMIILA